MKERALFVKHLSVMLRSGLTLTEALSITEETARGKLKRVLGACRMAVERGRTLSDALAEHSHFFSPLVIQTVRAGEQSGTLAENLENIAAELDKERELVAKVKGAMMYPIVVLVAALMMGLGVAFFILPKIVPLFAGLRTELPLSTRILIGSSHIVDMYGAWLFFGIIAGIVLLAIALRSALLRPALHAFFLWFPIIGPISRGSNLVRTNRTLGLLLKSGLTVDESLRITRDAVGNVHYRKALDTVVEHVAKGSKLAESLEANPKLFPIIMTRMIRVGEESGRFEETLFYLANFYESEVDNATKSLTTTLEPALLLLIGLVVGGLALAIITPIYEITGSIRR